jgi:hypothetical protein
MLSYRLALSVVVAVIGTLVIPLSRAAESGVEAGFVSLFDGQTLEGWSGDPRLWRVADGAIVATSTDESPLEQNAFLIWEGEVADFVLRLQFRVADRGVGNSGIQYRSRRFPEAGEWIVGGYQADIDRTNKYMGIVYEERGRGILAEVGEKITIEPGTNGKDFHKEVVGSLGEPAEILKSVTAGQWCDYEVEAIGNHLIHRINGHATAEAIDSDAEHAARSGLLALQLHAGPAMKIEFRRIRIKHLPTK